MSLRQKNLADHAPQEEASPLMTRIQQRNTVHVTVLSALIGYLERNGHSLAEFTRLSGVSTEGSNDPDARVLVATVRRCWQAALDLTRNPALGLAIGAEYSSQAHGVVGHLIAHSETLGDALRVLCRFQMLLTGGNTIDVVHANNEGAVVFHADEPDPHTWPVVVERIFASIVTLARNEVVGPVSLTRAEFDFAEPGHVEAYRTFFGVSCRFGRQKCRLVFPRANLDLMMRHRHSALHAILSREAETMRFTLNEEHQATRARLWNELPSLLNRGVIAARSAAETLNLSERTLHRRLSAEGTSYLELLDKARLERAMGLMAAPNVSLEEIALACGFLENSGFYRAFKRWTGMPPRAYRQSRVGDVA